MTPSKWRARTVSLAILGCLSGLAAAHPAMANDLVRLKREAARVSIARDDWGIAHVHGRSDADAVFGMIYAQAEDDFNRVESNYITSLGRTAEVEGEGAIWQDFRQRLFVDPPLLRGIYSRSPAWLKDLMNGWADGLNYYLLTHPEVRPKLIRRFEPWMALSFTEGSIGGDIAKVSLADLASFYGHTRIAALTLEDSAAMQEPSGSNGAAIGPSATRNGHALLLINPHTSFFFRSEMQVTSDAGLNAYGAATWGQFFIYQGFNAHAGWMHTTSTADVVDEFAEAIVRKPTGMFYRYGAEERPVSSSKIVLKYRSSSGGILTRDFTAFRTGHGPVVREAAGKWISVSMMNRPMAALQQSFARTKAFDLASFKAVAMLAANSSNDTIFADDKGETALLLPQFVPLRNDRYDYTQPVDGSDPETAWKGVTSFRDLPQVTNPSGGWLYNSNDGPWWAAGADSPKQKAFPRYVDQVGENARTPHAIRVFGARRDFTLQTLIDAAYDSELPAFERLLPGLLAAYRAAPEGERKLKLRGPIEALQGWNCRWSASSVETSLAVFWGEALWARVAPSGRASALPLYDYMRRNASPAQQLDALEEAVDRLSHDFGDWKTPWSAINRYQRLSGAISPTFSDAEPSTPVPFTSAQWGSLASFGARRYPGTNRYYGTSGNSFVAVVEFGPRVHVRAVTAGGESGNPDSKHFGDQALRYASGELRDVYFYPDELVGHVERTYHP